MQVLLWVSGGVFFALVPFQTWVKGVDSVTRIYLDVRTGEFVVSRNEAWVWYDFFWRLHIMDYEGGENFNGILLRSASVVAWMLVIAGAVLAALAARRSWRAARRPAHS